MTDHWPAVTCLCPTYGRFERLRDAVACFLLQDYPGEKRLLICNDAGRGKELSVDGFHTRASGLWIQNLRQRHGTLGEKRQGLLHAAGTAVVAHWDDDDLYLPWHLTQAVEVLMETEGAGCAKPGRAWWVVGPRTGFRVKGHPANVFEGQMVFLRDRALDLGGYPPIDSGQAKALLRAFAEAGELHKWNPPPDRLSYCYRWGGGPAHISACPEGRRGEHFARRNRDFGDGQPLIPGDDPVDWARERLEQPFRLLARGAAEHLSADAAEVFGARLGVTPEAGRSRG
ncbi:MAG: hypothetical protein ACOC7T_01220 [Planctomycetota bacterium]